MPTTYTHDLFGKKVYRNLSEEEKKLLRRHKNLFRIGLHGPDILFYYMASKNPVSRFGSKMHHETAREFFVQGASQVRETGDEELKAYLMGFACHYVLDKISHPFVEQMVYENVASHTLMEKEFDRYLMKHNGKNPMTYRPSDAIVPSYHYAKVIHRALPLVKTGNLYLCLWMMKFLTNRMLPKNYRSKECLIRLGTFPFGKKKTHSLLDFIMKKHAVPGMELQMEELQELFDRAVLEAPEYLQELWQAMETGAPLSDRWNQTYLG